MDILKLCINHSSHAMTFRKTSTENYFEKLALYSLQQAGDAVFWLDTCGNIHYVNEICCQRLEYTQEELTQCTIFDINQTLTPPQLDALFERLRKEQFLNFEGFHYAKSGKKIPVEICMNYIEFEGNEFTCSFARDITARKESEKHLRIALEEVERLRDQLQQEKNYLEEEIQLANNFEEIISASDNFKPVLAQVEQVATTSASVLILGETGTGKELLARAIHNLSHRGNRALIKVNCASLPTHLIESELFGHEQGAFTGALGQKIGKFEMADGGTIFLDEIAEIPLALQTKLLRILQEGEFERFGNPETFRADVRVIASSNRNLAEMVEQGTFRSDLFYRLNVFPIHVPPLRERKEDIPLLVNYFLQKHGPRVGKQIEKIPKRIIQTLTSYHFPGNVRELENMIERAIIVSKGKQLELGEWFPKTTEKVKPKTLATLKELEREHILNALALTKWRVSGKHGAAKLLDIKPTTLEARMKKLGIKRYE